MPRDGLKLDTPQGRSDRLRELRTKVREVEAEISRLESARWSATVENDADRHTAALAAIEGDDDHSPEIRNIDERLRDLRARRETLADAVRILSSDVAVDRARAAGAVAKELRPAHRQAVADIARALMALAAANDREAKLRGQVPGRASLPAAFFPGIGHPARSDSPVGHWMRLVEHHGILDRAELKALRKEAGL